MAVTQLEKDTLSRSFAVAKQLLADIEPKLKSINEIYASSGGVGTTLDQADLDSLPELSGLTVAQVADGEYAMAQALSAITAGYSALSQLAARFI